MHVVHPVETTFTARSRRWGKLLLLMLAVSRFGVITSRAEEPPPPMVDRIEASADDVASADEVVGGPPVVAAGLGQRLDERLSELAARGFSGVVVVARGPVVELAQGYGLADRRAKIPWTPATVFDIGSVTKQFTGAAILRLEVDGKLRVDDTLAEHFPDAPADKRAITIHQLLTHTAGFLDVLGEDYDPLEREDFVQGLFAAPLLTPPGTVHRYSNAGYSLLAVIIERVTGESYETALRRLVLAPAGLRETGYRLPQWPAGRVARGYRFGGDWGVPHEKRWAADGPYWNLRGNGGLLSTAWDLYRWHLAMETDAVLPAEARARWQAPHVPEGPRAPSSYGYGWSIMPTPRRTRMIWHDGSNGAFFADYRHYVDEGFFVLTATNNAADRRLGYQKAVIETVFAPPTATR